MKAGCVTGSWNLDRRRHPSPAFAAVEDLARRAERLLDRVGAVPAIVLFSVLTFLPGLATLPLMDRDEPRFAQASKQMVETSDFVDIRFGAEARNKKPVGIYWMQAAAVAGAEGAHVPNARSSPWVYRLPSLFGAIATVLLTFWTARAALPRRDAALAAALMSATILLGVEARIATTDAVVAATVTGAMGALARAWLRRDDPRAGLVVPAAFWTAIAIGILVKGPITPMIVALAAAVLSARARSLGWLRALRPGAGIVWCLLLVLPWFVLIALRTHGGFFAESIGHDALGKVAGGQEAHGAPPGYYLLAFFVTAWPVAPLAVLAAPALWRERGDPRVSFLLAWLLPSWLLFEGVPTKLPHYVLPLYPAVAIAVVLGLRLSWPHAKPGLAAVWTAFALLTAVPLAVLGVTLGFDGVLWRLDPLTIVIALMAALVVSGLAIAAQRAWRSGSVPAGLLATALCGVPVSGFVYGRLLTTSVAAPIALSQRLVETASSVAGPSCPTPSFATVSDREPSLMFAAGTSLFMTDAAGAARFLGEGACRVAFLDASDEAAVLAIDPSLAAMRARAVRGVNINTERSLDVAVYVRR